MRANFIPTLLLAVTSFLIFRLLYLRFKLPSIRFILIAFALGSTVPGVLFASNYILYLPYASWFVEAHSLPGAEILAGLSGSILGLLYASSQLRQGRLNLSILMVCSIMTAALIAMPFYKQLMYGVDYSSLKNEWKEDVCIQTSSYTCVPACCVTVIHKLGGKISEPELAKAAGSTTQGTEAWYLIRALRKRGWDVEFTSLKSCRKAPDLSIVGVTFGLTPHVVVILEKDSRKVNIGEPLSGPRTFSWNKFNERYHPGGLCITVKKHKQ